LAQETLSEERRNPNFRLLELFIFENPTHVVIIGYRHADGRDRSILSIALCFNLGYKFRDSDRIAIMAFLHLAEWIKRATLDRLTPTTITVARYWIGWLFFWVLDENGLVEADRVKN
jgi:hypothetical protein